MRTDFTSLPTRGEEDTFHVVIESPRGSRVKLKYEPELGAFTISRPLVLGVIYPFDWGFVPSTLASDGDPLDAMVLADFPTYPGVVVPCRPIAVVRVSQKSKDGGRERNDRLIAVPADAPRAGDIRDLDDLSGRTRQELAQFFVTAVKLANKGVKVLGWGDAKEADALVDASARSYRVKHAKGRKKKQG
jgi:inorganic pyrophosphatase